MVRAPSMAGERVRTYIRGLDEQMQGGVPTGHIVLLVCKPGAMKSSVAFNPLYHSAKQDGRGRLYITFEQDRDSLLATMGHLGIDTTGLEDKISVLDLGLIPRSSSNLATGRGSRRS